MWFYYLIFFVIVTSYFFTLNNSYKKPVYYLIAFFLVLIAGLRRFGIDADMATYIQYYNLLPDLSFVQVEPSFQLIGLAIKNTVADITFLFLFYSFLGVAIKVFAIEKLTRFYILSLLTYFSYYFLLHEMTQIRVGIASGFLLLSIPDIYERKPVRFLTKILAGTLFHYSLMVFSIFYFLNPRKINFHFHLGLIIFAYMAHFAGLHLITLVKLIPLSFIASKIDAYELLLSLDIHSAIDIFNPLFLFRVCFCLVLIYKWEVLYLHNKYSLLLLKIYSISNFIFIVFADLPVFAARLNQLLAVVEVILFPFIIYVFRPRTLALFAVILIGLGMMSIKLFYVGLLRDYFNL
jgi:hypothetical protein